MDCDHVEVISGSVVTNGHIQRTVGLNHGHQQGLRERLGSRPPFDDLTFLENAEGLHSGNPSLLCSEQRMVAPLDAPASRCGPNGVKLEHSALMVLTGRKPQTVYWLTEKGSMVRRRS